MNEMELRYFHTDMSFPFFIQYGFHEGTLDLHTHKDFTELVLVMEGTAMHGVGNETHLVKAGDVFVIGGNTAHEYKDARNFHLCNIMFRSEYFFGQTLHIKKSTGFHALFYLEPYMTRELIFRSRLHLPSDKFFQISNLIDKMIQEYHNQLEGWQDLINALFLELVVLLSRAYSLPSAENEQGILLIAHAVSYIEKNFQTAITVEKLAGTACLSIRHFNRIFKSTYQLTPMQYVIRLRILYAMDLLKNTKHTITDIAALSGFSDNNYFARKFREMYQITPTEYRKQQDHISC